MPDLAGRTALVTGASGGLGPAVVDAYLEAGATVLGVSRRAGSQRPSERYAAVAADLTTREGAKSVVAKAIEFGGRLDIVAHVMGGFDGGAPVAETSEQVWDKMMALNLRAAFLTFRAALPSMLERRWGRIVAVGSKNAVDPAPGLSAYNASKAGLNSLVQTIAEEVRDEGVTANVVLTTIIDTPANREAMPDMDFDRWVRPEVLARELVWLSGEEAGDINGALIPIYGRVS